MGDAMVPSTGRVMWQLLNCRSGAALDLETWLLVAATSAAVFWYFVRHLLRIAAPARRESLHSAAVVSCVVGLFLGACLSIVLADGHFTWPRSGRKVFACGSPVEFWGFMAVGDLCMIGCLAFVAMCVIRLRRPYRRFSDPVP